MIWCQVGVYCVHNVYVLNVPHVPFENLNWKWQTAIVANTTDVHTFGENAATFIFVVIVEIYRLRRERADIY